MSEEIRSKRSRRKQGSPGIPTVIGEKCLIVGTIENAFTVQLEGTLEGNIMEADSLIIGESGVLNGNVGAKSVVVFGQVNGDVSATDSIEIKKTGRISGKLSTRLLSVDRGASYTGKVVMSQLPLNSG